MHLRRTTLAVTLLLLSSGIAAADVVILKNGRKLRGGYAEVGGEVVYNPYFSRHPEMVFGVQRFRRDQVKELIREDPPLATFLTRRLSLAPDDIEGRLELAEWCKARKLKAERDLVLLDILREDPTHEAALRAIGKSKFKKLSKGNPAYDPSIRARVDEYLALADPEDRKKAYGKLKRERSLSLPQEYFDRMIRSAAQKKELTKDRPLTLGSAESPGVYTVFVPKEYDPRRAWPLVIGLHGGGAGGKDGKEVVGSGPSAMNFYIRQAGARGYIVVCPTALLMPWGASPNVAYLRSLIDEAKLLYNIDVNRIYMTGHSAGGFGTWRLAPRFAEELAAVSPMAGGGGPNSKLEATNTPVFIFHGADDGVVGPGSDRGAAKAMADGGLDYHYTELAGVGHGFPRSIQEELFDFFDVRRLAVGRGRKVPTAAVRSSFLAKVSREEKRYLGDPLSYGAAGEGGKKEWKRRLKDLRLGGGSAEAAATRLGELGDEDSVKPIGDLLRSPKTPKDVKAHAARALGLIGHEDGYAGLAAGLRSGSDEVVAASAKAMVAIRASKSGEALVGALSYVTKILEGKRMGDRIHISDWKPWMGALRTVVEGVGELEVTGGAAAIHRTVVKSVYSGKWAVLYSTRIPMDPWTPRLRLAEAVCTAIVRLGQPEGRAALEEMKAATPDERDNRNAGVIAACEQALAKLPK